MGKKIWLSHDRPPPTSKPMSSVTFTTRTATRTLRQKKKQQSRIFFRLNFDVYVVVQFYPWFKFYILLFLGMVMHDNEFQTKEKN